MFMFPELFHCPKCGKIEEEKDFKAVKKYWVWNSEKEIMEWKDVDSATLVCVECAKQ